MEIKKIYMIVYIITVILN